MKLTALAQLYSSDLWNDNSHTFYSIIKKEDEIAQEHIPITFRENIPQNRFHDWYLTRVMVDGNRIEDGIVTSAIWIDIEKKDIKSRLVFCGLDNVKVNGGLYLAESNFPSQGNLGIPLAQVLDIWFAFDIMLECTILLENGRYIEIRFRSCEFADCNQGEYCS